jgi:hypothetical protein
MIPNGVLCLSVRQPCPWAIVNGFKVVENRMWDTTHRGSRMIRAGKGFDREGYHWMAPERRGILPEPGEYPMGGIGEIAARTEMVTEFRSSWFFGPLG